MICMAVLQNCTCFVEGETGSCSEACATCDVNGNEGVSINVEEEIPEAVKFPPIKTKNEVRLCGVCEVEAFPDFGPFIDPKRKL